MCGLAVFERGQKEKTASAAPAAELGPRKFPFDPKTLVWPSPPYIGRIHWLNYFAGAKIEYTTETTAKPKASWTDRMAGGQSPRGILKIDENLNTTAPGVFAGGDVAFGARILVEALANGHRSARSIHLYLSCKTEKTVKSRFRILPDWKMPKGFLTTPRQKMPMLPSNRRIGIAEVELGFDEEQGRAEGLRCLNCQVNTIFDGSKCILCAGCVDVCPENCLRLVDRVQVSGDARYDALIHQRYGVTGAELKAEQAGAIIKNEEKCMRCGLCADRCPTGAITMESLERQEREVFE